MTFVTRKIELNTQSTIQWNRNAPVFVEAASAVIRKMLGEDSLELTGSARSVDVSDNSDDDQWRSFDDGDSLNNLLLVDLGSGLVDLK